MPDGKCITPQQANGLLQTPLVPTLVCEQLLDWECGYQIAAAMYCVLQCVSKDLSLLERRRDLAGQAERAAGTGCGQRMQAALRAVYGPRYLVT
jgi:hypothetical protein